MSKNTILIIHFFILILSSYTSNGKDKDSTAYNSSLIEVDDLLIKMETISNILDSINKISKNGFNTHAIEEGLPPMIDQLKIINDNIVLYGKVLNIKNLQMFQVLLDDIEGDLEYWRSSLFRYNKELVKMKIQMSHFSNDSIAIKIKQDTIFHNLYSKEVIDIQNKWAQTRHFTTSNLLRITRLQAQVSKAYFQTIELEELVTNKLREFRGKYLGKEFDPLYAMHNKSNKDSATTSLVKKSYQGQMQILGYYIRNNWYNQVFISVLGVGFFFWIFFNFRKIRNSDQAPQLADSKLKYLSAFPILTALVVILNIAPFFDLNPPSTYFEIVHFFLLITLTILFAQHWPRHLFYHWLVMITLYILFSVTYAIITPDLAIRICLLLLNITSLIFGLLFLWKLQKELALPAFVKVIFVLYILLNFLSAVCNIFGRVSLSKVLSMAAIFGLTQIIGLSFLIQILTESLYLQIVKSKVTGGMVARLNYDKILKSLYRSLSVVILALWIVIFTTNLGIYSPLFSFVISVLSASRKLGSITFTFGNILLFF
ncbi:MAG TPA: hypothetical protein VNW99_04445, partial [Cytophagaceae bacterium]|nr:hypothetical protein [Cytophagaceae bacterium]